MIRPRGQVREFDREAFKRALQHSGLSVAEVARGAGVPHSHQVYAWLRGDMRPTVRTCAPSPTPSTWRLTS